MALMGIDISKHNYDRPINWQQVVSSGKVQFVIIQAGYGTSTDPKFEASYASCKQYHIPCGIYWFCQASNEAGCVKEASACLNAIRGKTFEYPIFYDVEDVGGKNPNPHKLISLGADRVSNNTRAFFNTMKMSGVRNLGLYSNASALNDYFSNDLLTGYKVWVAQFGGSSPSYYKKGTYCMWQYSERGTIPGIHGNVDLDYDYGATAGGSNPTSGVAYYPPVTQITKVEYAVQWAVNIANDDSHGYDQGSRWGPDYDCSSLVISAYENAGVPVKTNHASNTRNMEAIFIKTGFEYVSNFNPSSYANLIRGDVLLSHGHTAMYVGDGQLVEASQNEFKGAHGGAEGDQTKREIWVHNYYNNGWYRAFRYTAGGYTTTAGLNGLTAFGAAFGGAVNVDWTTFTPYIATIDRMSKDIDIDKLKEIKVVALMIEGGYLYDKSHMVVARYRNPKIDEQVKLAKDAEMPYALYFDIRARNVDEAKAELQELQFIIQKYTPPLGCWLTFAFKEEDKTMNDSIIKTYKERLTKLGLVGKMGFYVDRDQLSTISWDDWKEDFYWWMVEHVEEISEVEQLLYPEFFMLDPSDVESHTITGYYPTEGMVYDTTPPAGGTTISIPSSVNQHGIEPNYTNYNYFYSNDAWDHSSIQHKLAIIWGKMGKPSSRNIATIEGHYLVAMTPKFGTTGDLLTITLEDGTRFTAIMGDSKGSDASTVWGHELGRGSNAHIDIVEWEKNGIPYSKTDTTTKIDLTGWAGKKVVSVTNHGQWKGLK